MTKTPKGCHKSPQLALTFFRLMLEADPDGLLQMAHEQNPVEVKKWLDKEYPEIAQRAREEGAEIHWGEGRD